MPAERPAPLHGYIMPLLTPFNADGSVDERGMRTNISYLIGEGIHGITLTGSFGEFPLLTEQERIRLYEVAAEEAAGRCAVIAGTAHARTEVVIELGDAAARIQELFLAGRKEEAAAAVPDEFLDETALIGPVERIRERYRLWADDPITGITVNAEQPEALELMAELAELEPARA